MLKKESHPFNDTFGRQSISPLTKKLILGSFPPFDVVNHNNPKASFYYTSSDNIFWDLFKEVFDISFKSEPENIIAFLREKQFGIIDIIRVCYRKNNRSSNDEDLAIIELEDIIEIIQFTDITDIYTTSKFVSTLLKEELIPLYDWVITPGTTNGFPYEIYSSPQKYLRVFTLYSPSPNGLRGIQKGLNNTNPNIKAKEHRLNQYRSLFLIS
jgi:G:T/U-mismatch repair DNA glycosylase